MGRLAASTSAAILPPRAEVTALVGGPSRAAGLERLGASTVLTGLSETGPEFDFVLESIGGQILGAALARLAIGGTLVGIRGP